MPLNILVLNANIRNANKSETHSVTHSIRDIRTIIFKAGMEGRNIVFNGKIISLLIIKSNYAQFIEYE